MCNDYRLKVDAATITADLGDLGIEISAPEGVPNLEPRDDIRITDTAPIVRPVAAEPDPGELAGKRGAAELVQRRWSWPAPNKRPVYNFRSDGRAFGSGRCLIIADGFYEFTDPPDPKAKRKLKWLFTLQGEPWFCIAGIWRAHPEIGEAFTMLTMPPGPDIAPYHDRQIAVLRRADWAAWLDHTVPAEEILKPLPAGSLQVERAA